MITLNTGVVLLNPAVLSPKESAAFCVLGMPRGGTTMAARLLEAAGVFMGERLSVTAEDSELAPLLSEAEPDEEIFDDLVRTRSSTYKRWGFKAPYRYHWDLLAKIDGVRYLAVFRDVLAVANRNKISASADVLRSMRDNLALETQIVEFLATSNRPALLFSYEKAVLSPRDVSESLLRFVGCEPSRAKVTRLCQVVQPNESKYVAAQDPLQLATTLHVDLLRRNRIAGWARHADGKQVSIRIEINERPVVETRCTLPRADLAKLFGGRGQFAFDVKVPVEFVSGSPVIIKNAQDGRVLFRGSVS